MPEEFHCKKCTATISGHNQYCHDEMCDKCFFEEYYPEDAQIFETDLNAIKRHCTSRSVERENLRFWEFLKSDEMNQEEFQKIVKEVSEQIECTACGNCCKVLSPIFNEEEIIQKFEYMMNVCKKSISDTEEIVYSKNEFTIPDKFKVSL